MIGRDRSGKILKKLLVVLLALIVAVVLSVYLFIRINFSRTYATQIAGVVMRCSEGIKIKYAGGEWKPLKAADRLEEGTQISMPESGRSFMSFDGVRLLSAGMLDIDITGKRAFSLKGGEVAVAAANRKRSLKISLGDASLATRESTLKLGGGQGLFFVDCISGKIVLKLANGSKRELAAGQRATISGMRIEIAASQANDPFAVMKESVIDRIRERFDRVVSRYARRSSGGGERTRLGPSGGDWTAEGWEFASYAAGTERFLNLTQAGFSGSVADYYDTLFAPSNRTILIGKQKIVPLTPTYAASFPIWSHDGSMIAFTETSTYSWPARVRVVRVDDLDNPWDISQEYEAVLPFFPITWAPDDKHVLFMVADHMEFNTHGMNWWWSGPYHIKIAPVDPSSGPVREFASPFHDIPMPLRLPVGKTISPWILKLPWGDALLCANWGNIAYIPVEQDGQSVANAPGLFLTNFNPRRLFVMGGSWSSSGSMILFTAAEDLDFDKLQTYILYDVEDILDGFAQPPRSPDDPRLKKVAPSPNPQLPGNFSYDESLVFYQEDVNGAWIAINPVWMERCNFDLFYADARPDQLSRFTQIHLPGNQMFLRLSPEGNRLVYSNYDHLEYELRVVSFDIEADIDIDLGGVLIDNSGTNLIVPPGALEENFNVRISTPFTIGEEAEIPVGETRLFALRMLDAQGLEKPKFIEPMTLTIRYTQEEIAGLDEGMLEIYYYDESDTAHPAWVPLGATVDLEHNEITVEIQHFSKFSVGPKHQ